MAKRGTPHSPSRVLAAMSRPRELGTSAETSITATGLVSRSSKDALPALASNPRRTVMSIVGAILAMLGTAVAQDGPITGPLLIPKTSMGEFFIDDPQDGYAQGAPQSGAEAPPDIQAALAYANRPFQETDMHEFCRSAEHDREFGYRLGAYIEGEPVSMRIIADQLSLRDGLLFGHSVLRMGAYVGTVYVWVEIAASLPNGITKGDAVLVEGTLGRNEFWANISDSCAISIAADQIMLDGF